MTLLINTTLPVYFACAVHCDLGEVGSINAPAFGTGTFGAFVALARSDGELGGFDNIPTDGSGVGSGSGNVVVIDEEFNLGPAATTGTDSGFTFPTSSADSSSSSDSSSGPSTGTIVGAVIGGIAGLTVLLGIAAMWRRNLAKRKEKKAVWTRRVEMSLRRGKEKQETKSEMPASGPGPDVPPQV